MAIKVTARKYNGDDAYSWALFVEGQREPIMTGLSKAEVPYYKKMAKEKLEKERIS